MIVQYLLFMTGALLSIYWPRVGGGLHVLTAFWAIWFFRGASSIVIYISIAGPLLLLGAFYQKMPDKESPLWDKYFKVIYWWTATEVDEKSAYIVVYNGQVWPRPKKAYWGYLGFRAVKAVAKDRP